MGFFQATNGIDSKANVLVSGSLFVSSNINTTNLFTTNISASGTISGSNISASGDIIAQDDLFAKGINSTTSQTLPLVVVDTSTGQLYYTEQPSQLARPSNATVFITGSTNATFNASSVPTIFQINGGTILAYPNSATTGRVVIGLADILTDYQVSIVNYGGTTESQGIQITTPNSPGGFVWDVFFTGYVSSTNEIWWEQFLNQNSGTGVTPSRELDQSGRIEITMDFSSNVIVCWGSNWA